MSDVRSAARVEERLVAHYVDPPVFGAQMSLA
jgi:hypothetical protein